MSWMNWRLHRTEAVIGVLLFAGLIATMVYGMASIDAAHESAVEAGCFGSNSDPLCNERIADYFERRFDWDRWLTAPLHGIPVAIAVLLMIPTLHELERGTYRLAWTQSISRRRWAISRLGFAAGIATAVAVIWTICAAEWRDIVLQSDAPSFNQNVFSLSPTVLIGYVLFAAALGLLLAVIIRRLVPALVLLGVGFIGVRVLTSFYLRERYREPEEETVAAAFGMNSQDMQWVVDESWLSSTGERLSWDSFFRLCSWDVPNQPSDAPYQSCITEHGLRFWRAYHPLDRFDQFQAIETALFLGLAAGLFACTYWWLARRAV